MKCCYKYKMRLHKIFKYSFEFGVLQLVVLLQHWNDIWAWGKNFSVLFLSSISFNLVVLFASTTWNKLPMQYLCYYMRVNHLRSTVMRGSILDSTPQMGKIQMKVHSNIVKCKCCTIMLLCHSNIIVHTTLILCTHLFYKNCCCPSINAKCITSYAADDFIFLQR